MFSKITLALALSLGLSASANTLNETLARSAQSLMRTQLETQGLNLKKGDLANYSIDMSVVKGTMKMEVLDVLPEGVWIQQLADLGFAGKQDSRMLMDPNTGEIKKFIVNGKSKLCPKASMN